MKSSESATARRAVRPKGGARNRDRQDVVPVLIAIVCMLACAAGIARLRAPLADTLHRLRATSDVYTLPPPEQAVVASLGWRSALADFVFAHVLVSYGLHFQEHRRFEFVGLYLDTITTLDPKFRQPYLLADTLLTLQAEPPRRQDYEKARELLEKGMAEFPYDAMLWTTAGQFMAYLAPTQLGDAALAEQWRIEGARRLAHACELVSSNENLPYHCITAAGLLSNAGHREAVIQFVERVLAVSDNEEIRTLALGFLERTIGERERERAEHRNKLFREVWGKDLPFVSKDQLLVLGPRFDPARCAGLVRERRIECASSWREWGEQVEPE